MDKVAVWGCGHEFLNMQGVLMSIEEKGEIKIIAYIDNALKGLKIWLGGV